MEFSKGDVRWYEGGIGAASIFRPIDKKSGQHDEFLADAQERERSRFARGKKAHLELYLFKRCQIDLAEAKISINTQMLSMVDRTSRSTPDTSTALFFDLNR